MAGAPDADSYLIAAVQRGEADAWREVIARFEGRLVRFARRMLADKSEADDVVQETFLGLLRSLAHYDGARSLETYLFAILRNKIKDHLRKQGRGGRRESLDQLQLDEAPSAWTERETPSGLLEGREGLTRQRAALAAALRTWVEQVCAAGRFQDLVVVEMLTVLGLRNKEAAADLGLSETAVAGVKFRVIEQWRKLAAAAPGARDWQEADLAADSSVATVWREEGVSCLKRSTLGRYLLGALDPAWTSFVEFHVAQAGCDRCNANLEDLRAEEEQDAAARAGNRERYFASSVGFLSKRPE